MLAKLIGFCMSSLGLAQALPNSGCLSATPVLSKLEPGSAIKDGELFLSFPSWEHGFPLEAWNHDAVKQHEGLGCSCGSGECCDRLNRCYLALSSPVVELRGVTMEREPENDNHSAGS